MSRREEFPVTQWTLVRAAGADEDDSARREALGRLLRRYLPAMEAHLAQKRLPHDRVADLLQGFVSDKIVEQNLLARADRERGRFRTFLLTSLQHYVIDQFRQDSSARRSPDGGRPASLGSSAEPAVMGKPAEAFDIAWARQLLSDTLVRMRSHCEVSGRQDLWQVFEERVLRATMEGGQPSPYEELAARFELESTAQAANLLVTAKRMYARVLRSLIAEYARDEEEVEQEIADLHTILAAVRG